MKIKNCAVKLLRGDAWLHHTASGYKVRMNREGLETLKNMAARLSEAEMTENERLIYGKLAPKGMAGPDTGLPRDRTIPIKSSSLLESVELEFSGRCNLRCAHCFAALSGRDLARGTLEKVFKGIDALEPVTLALTGGEPLLSPLLPAALEMAEARHLRVVLTTNATLVEASTAELLARRGVAKAVVSLDFFRDTHDALRGAGSFERAVTGIKLLVSRGVPVSITAMVQESTAGRLDEFQKFCLQELGASGIRYSSVMPIGRAEGRPELGLAGGRIAELFSKGAISASGGSERAFSRLAGERTFYCGAGVGECFVSADGKVYACHYFQNLGEAMGDLADRPLEEIYRAYPASGAAAVDFDWEGMTECRACAHFSACRGGCRARARLLGGSWHAPDEYSCCIHGHR